MLTDTVCVCTENRAVEGTKESDESENLRSSSRWPEGRVMTKVVFPPLRDLYSTMGQLIRYP